MNTKSKLEAISIGIAAIIIMVSLFATVTVSASPGVDITDCWIGGDDNKVYFTIYSEAKAEGYALLNVNGTYEERKNFSLNPQDTATLSFRDYRWSECEDVEVCVDDSCCELPCEPEPTHLPDLVVSDKWETVTANGQVIVHFIVANIGDAQAGSSTACMEINGMVVDTDSVPRLGAGTSYTGAFAPEPCPPGETLDVTVCADVYGVVDESNETNNCLTNTFTCPEVPPLEQPDLVVSKKWEDFVGPDTFVVHYTVTNVGNKRAGGNKIGKYVNGVLCPHDIQTVPALGPGAIHCGEFKPVDCSYDQILNVTVCADIYKVLAESNETNNCVTNILVVPGTHVVIHAFDQNPAGYPTTEWVMLYNPANESVNISGWSISSIKYSGGRSFTLRNISLAARNYLTFVPGEQWLHDEDETIMLKDAAGNIVDKIVNASDGDADNRYWERFDSDWQFGLQTLDTGGMRRGTVKYVYDGDTILISPVCANATEFITYNVTDDGKIYISPVAMAGIQSVRLDGIDAPELKTEEGNISMEFLDELCSGKEVVFDIDDCRQYDKYNRVLAMVFCANGTNVNQEMLRNGSAIPLIILPSEFVPYANYTYRPLNPVVNQSITFNASSSWTFDPEAAIISYEWSFGDGTNGTGEITNHSFHSPGNYTVRLEVTDSDGEERRCNAREMTIRICSKNP